MAGLDDASSTSGAALASWRSRSATRRVSARRSRARLTSWRICSGA
jgi:hypothetical protein